MNGLKSFLIDNLSGFSAKAIPNFIFSFLVCTFLALILGKLYVKYGNALTNRKSFARNFILLSLATMFIITVVKSSLALSLGLVGALSIVRFRAAIKDPEELIYLFLCISIGLGCGAGLTILTIIAFAGFACIVIVIHRTSKAVSSESLYLTVSGDSKMELKNIVETLQKYCVSLKLKRTDENANVLEASFLVDFKDFSALEEAKVQLKKINQNITIAIFDNSRDF